MAVTVAVGNERGIAGSYSQVSAAAHPARWERRYARTLVGSDTILLAIVMTLVLLVAPHPATVQAERLGVSVPVVAIGIGIVAVILALLSLTGSRAPRVVGVGSQEYRAVVQANFLTFMSVALLAYILGVDGLHFILAYGLVATTGTLVLGRWIWRKWLVSQRRQGKMSNRVLLVGSEESVANTARDLRRTPAAGLLVVGACTPTGRVADVIPGTDIAVSGSVDNVIHALHRVDADTVLITSANELSAGTVRSLSWQLEPGRQHLIVAPSLTDIGGPRLHARPVAGLPLVHVETPRYQGGKLHELY